MGYQSAQAERRRQIWAKPGLHGSQSHRGASSFLLLSWYIPYKYLMLEGFKMRRSVGGNRGWQVAAAAAPAPAPRGRIGGGIASAAAALPIKPSRHAPAAILSALLPCTPSIAPLPLAAPTDRPPNPHPTHLPSPKPSTMRLSIALLFLGAICASAHKSCSPSRQGECFSTRSVLPVVCDSSSMLERSYIWNQMPAGFRGFG